MLQLELCNTVVPLCGCPPLLYHRLSVLTHVTTSCSVSAPSGTAHWKCWRLRNMSKRASTLSQCHPPGGIRRHRWAKEVLEPEWKLGTEKALFTSVQGLIYIYIKIYTHTHTHYVYIYTTQHELLVMPGEVYVTHNSSYNSPLKRGREREERVQHSPESIKSSPADRECKTHDQPLVPSKFPSIRFWGNMGHKVPVICLILNIVPLLL